MKFLINIKAGALFAPASLIAIYFLLVVLDLFSTHLASPDLRYEGNWVVILLNLNWYQFIILYSITVLLITVGLFMGLNYLHFYYKVKTQKKPLGLELLPNLKLFGSYIALACFYSHIISISHVLINNYFVYIYLFKIENIFTKLSIGYISYQSHFQLYILIVPILIGYSLAYFKILKIRKLYMLE